MTEPRTLPAREGAALSIAIEDDSPPLARQIAQTLRNSARAGHALEVLAGMAGSVAVRSHDTPQVATVTLCDGVCAVSGGVLAHTDAGLVLDLHGRFALTEDPTGDTALALAVADALTPALPDWRMAGQAFWEATRSIPGIPDVFVAVVDGPDGHEEARFGEGPSEYLMAGSADMLAGVFSGADDFIVAVGSGLGIKGTLSQLSVMVAASWKVRFDV